MGRKEVCVTSLDNVMVIKSMFRCFKLVSGLKVNFFKRNFGGLRIGNLTSKRYANLLNCRILCVPFTYLGIPIGVNPWLAATWQWMFKFSKKLSRQKHRTLSFVGRICLINYMLGSLLIFFLPFFKLPRLVRKKIVSMQKNFLWGCEEGRWKIAWVCWKKICKSEGEGGLGVKDVFVFNEALLAKW